MQTNLSSATETLNLGEGATLSTYGVFAAGATLYVADVAF